MDCVIKFQNVSKKFHLYTKPIDRLKESLHPLRKRFHHEHWVLKEINFSVQRGETVGIMGRNGAGKSTLLQLLTSVLEASEGKVAVKGRISALLELGAGFNPEMTGRENVLAQAILMGMSRREMNLKLPDIEEFADIGEYIDQPVKSYSSGMFVRLAFAMFISVEPDILIIDEALAVGDAAFQEKCFKKLKEFKKAGKTFLLVSHSASMISGLCERVIVLEHGKVSFDGEPRPGLQHYGQLLFGTSAAKSDGIKNLSSSNDESVKVIKIGDVSLTLNKEVFESFFSFDTENMNLNRQWYNKDETRSGDRKNAYICDYLIMCNHHYAEASIYKDDIVDVYIKIAVLNVVENPRISINFHTPNGSLIYGANSTLLGLRVDKFESDEIKYFRFTMNNMLHPGSYLMSLGLVDNYPVNPMKLDIRESIAILEVSGAPGFNGLVDLKPELYQIDPHSVTNEKS